MSMKNVLTPYEQMGCNCYISEALLFGFLGIELIETKRDG